MTSLPDINVLFPLLCGSHEHHDAAWTWWERQPDQSVGLCWLTQLGVLRLLSHPKVMGSPLKPDHALAIWAELADDPRCFWIAESPPGHTAQLTRLVKTRLPAPSLWSDAWLAALAESASLRMVTFDKGFSSFHLRNLLLLGKSPDGKPA